MPNHIYRPSYTLSIVCPSCGDDIDIEFTERGRYEFAPEVPIVCDGCGYDETTELVQLAWDANDVAAEKQHMERLADA